jgi:hypothetical protein
MKHFWLVATAVALAACGSDDGPAGPQHPDITGRFEGQLAVNVFGLDQLAAVAPPVAPVGFSCRATADITSQANNLFEGELSLTEESEGCSVGPFFLCSGTIDGSGNVTMQWEWRTLCTSVAGDPELQGRLNGNVLSVSTSFTCDEEDFTMSFDGFRD